MRPPPAGLAELASAFAAKQVDGPPFDPIWHFWPGFVRWDGNAFHLQNDGRRFVSLAQLHVPTPFQRTTLNGLAQDLDTLGSVQCGPWVIGSTITVHKEKMATAGIWLRRLYPTTEHPPRPLFWIRRNTDPEGWPIAVMALYTKDASPMVDYLLESDRHQERQEELQEELRICR